MAICANRRKERDALSAGPGPTRNRQTAQGVERLGRLGDIDLKYFNAVLSVVALAIVLAATSGTAASLPRETGDRWQPVERVMVRIAPPSDADLSAGSFGTRAWRVRFRGTALEVSPLPLPRPQVGIPFEPMINTATMGDYGSQPTSAIRVGDAWFLAYYHGEFGGGLWIFSADGKVGRRLIDTEVYGLQRFGNDVLVVTSRNALMFMPPLTVHRFGRSGGMWQEISHTDFPVSIAPLVHIGSHLYGMAHTKYAEQAFSEIDLTGGLRTLWHFSGSAYVSDLAIAHNDDLAIGAKGFVARLRRRGNTAETLWYAPRDCVTYKRAEDDRQGLDARCVPAPQAQAYMRRRSIPAVPASFQSVSNDGRWMLTGGRPQYLLRLSGPDEVRSMPLPREASHLFFRLLGYGDDVILTEGRTATLWLRRDTRWSNIGVSTCSNSIAMTNDALVCHDAEDGPGAVRWIGFDGTALTSDSTRSAPERVVPGSANDAWFSEKDTPVIGHLSGRGTEELPISSPIRALSSFDGSVWFTEADELHYGFVGADGKMQERPVGQYDRAKSIAASKNGAWLAESLGGTRIITYHLDADGKRTGAWVAGVRTSIVTQDGTLWSESDEWPTIVRMTEDGKMTSYALRCADKRLSLVPGPQNGIWFRSREPNCSGYIDARAITLRDFPNVESVDFH